MVSIRATSVVSDMFRSDAGSYATRNGTQSRTTQLKRVPAKDNVFAPEVFSIYPWPVPVPRDLPRLTDSQKAWKHKIDEREKAADVDDGSDDWYAFDDSINKRLIGRALVNRAKRAFWSRKTWYQFSEIERKAYDEKVARKQSEVVLSNQVRLEVLHELKRRLCEEIWLESYEDPSGYVRFPIAAIGLGSRQILPPTAEEAADGIVGWSREPDGFVQPFYEGESEAPAMTPQFRRDLRTERALQAVLEGDGEEQGTLHPLDVMNKRLRLKAVRQPIWRGVVVDMAACEFDIESSDEGEARRGQKRAVVSAG